MNYNKTLIWLKYDEEFYHNAYNSEDNEEIDILQTNTTVLSPRWESELSKASSQGTRFDYWKNEV